MLVWARGLPSRLRANSDPLDGSPARCRRIFPVKNFWSMVVYRSLGASGTFDHNIKMPRWPNLHRNGNQFVIYFE